MERGCQCNGSLADGYPRASMPFPPAGSPSDPGSGRRSACSNTPVWSKSANMGQRLAGGNRSWCPELEVPDHAGQGGSSGTHRGTEEMMQRRLIYLHVISLFSFRPGPRTELNRLLP